jgi:Spy/CpxP family protein refolding chaperone
MTTSAKTLTALAAAATLGLAAFASAQPAQAHQHHGHHHHHHRHFAFLAPASVYAYSAPSDCYWTRQRVWDGWGWHLCRVRVCV